MVNYFMILISGPFRGRGKRTFRVFTALSMMNTLVLVCQKGKIPKHAAYHFTRGLLIAIHKHKMILFRNWDTTGSLLLITLLNRLNFLYTRNRLIKYYKHKAIQLKNY